MKLYVSGAETELPAGLTVQQWLDHAAVRNPEVALIRVNETDVSPGERAHTVLKEGDHIHLLYFLGDS